MGNQVQYPGIALDIGPDIIRFLINNQIEEIDGPVKIPTTKIQAGDLIIKYDNSVLILVVGVLFYDVDQFG